MNASLRSLFVFVWAFIALTITPMTAVADGPVAWAMPQVGGKIVAGETRQELLGWGRYAQPNSGGHQASTTLRGTHGSCVRYEKGSSLKCDQVSAQVGGADSAGTTPGATWKAQRVEVGARVGTKTEGPPSAEGPWKWVAHQVAAGPQGQVVNGSWKDRTGSARGNFKDYGAGVAAEWSFEGCGGNPKEQGCTFKDRAGATVVGFPWRSAGTPSIAGGGSVTHLWRVFRTQGGTEFYVGPQGEIWASQGAKPSTTFGLRGEVAGPYGGYGGVTAGYSPQNGGAGVVSVDFSTGPFNRVRWGQYHCNLSGAGTVAVAAYRAGQAECLPAEAMTASATATAPVAVATAVPTKPWKEWTREDWNKDYQDWRRAQAGSLARATATAKSVSKWTRSEWEADRRALRSAQAENRARVNAAAARFEQVAGAGGYKPKPAPAPAPRRSSDLAPAPRDESRFGAPGCGAGSAFLDNFCGRS